MHKPPSWNQIRADATAFAARWADETDENAGSQSFWNEFLAIFGIDRKRVATFEARAQRVSTGGRGRIDLLWPGVLVAEHKSAGKDLAAAEDQAIDYLESIGDAAFPGHVITSDFGRMRVRDLGGDNIPFEFPLKDLPKEIDRFGFIAGYSSRKLNSEQEHEVDVAAARLMASLYEQFADTGMTDHEISALLIRLLFLLFGDDTGLWEKGLFLEFLETRTQSDGSDLGPQIALLFQTLDRPADRRPPTLDELLLRFPYVNGGLFMDRLDIPVFTADMRTTLIECCLIDWGSIVPAIFGSLFQAVKSKEARRSLGEHYTTEKNILRLIGPLFLDDLHASVDKAWHDAKTLKRLRSGLGQMRFLDPACGCGNFLIIGYREMRRLELRIMRRLRELTGEDQLSLDATLGLQVSPSQFHGIEIEEWPARIAEAAMFLVDHQMNLELAREFGEAPDRLPISTGADIHIGNAIRMDWADVLPPTSTTLVLGNPPYSGGLRLTDEQREDRELTFSRMPVPVQGYGRLDYVACWYVKAMHYLAGSGGRAAFVMTNSIAQGEQPRSLSPLAQKLGIEISFAHRTFEWTSEAPGAANVHVVIVGFNEIGVAEGSKTLFEYPTLKSEPAQRTVKHINYWLIDYEDIDLVKHTKPLIPGIPGMTVGSQPTDGGGLTISPEEYPQVVADPIAARYVREFPGAEEMLAGKKRWCFWLEEAEPSDLRNSPVLRERLTRVRESRLKSPTAAFQRAADSPSLFTHRKHPNTSYLALPQTSSSTRSYIPARYYDESVVVSNKLMLIPDCPIWVFGTLQSSTWTTWVANFGGRLKSDFNVTADLTYNAFPFVRPDGGALQSVEQAAQGVLDARAAHPNSSLADLYDPLAMPKDLRDAHNALDKTILSLYGLQPDASESEILTALIARYKELESVNQLPLPASGNRKTPRAGATSPAQAPAIRAWATANGLTVPSRGRIPRDVVTAYNQAHGAPGDE